MVRRTTVFLTLTLPLLASLPQSASADGAQPIWPKRVAGPNGEAWPAIPLRFYFEYGHGTAESKNHPLSTVDIERDRFTIGADFMTSWLSFFGLNIQFTKVHDQGTQQPFVFSLDTQKDFTGGHFYYAHYVAPRLLAGFSVDYHRATGRSIYNLVVVNHETSKYYSFAPFLQHEYPVSNAMRLTQGIALYFNRGDYSYDINIPPTAATRETILRVPIGVEYDVTRNFTVSGIATWNQILSIETFDNMPAPDRSTLTLTAAARYRLDNGMSLYGHVSHDVLDDAYRSTRFTIGMSVAPSFFWAPLGAPPRTPPRIVK
ncbi:MAG: hypothetical protein ACRECO_07970 [Xanthobacteraceae bacterium]